MKEIKKVIMITDVFPSENEGIFKKVNAQSRAISRFSEACILICKTRKQSTVIRYAAGEKKLQEIHDNSVLTELKLIVKAEQVTAVYIRHMLPAPGFLLNIRWLKSRGIIVYYEIPTYPYFQEQFNSSTHKLRTLTRLLIDAAAWPVLYMYIDRLVVIRSNTKAHLWKKMFGITNGIQTDSIKTKAIRKNVDVFKMVIVGTLYKYHGMDRLLKGVEHYISEEHSKKIEVHIIGDSPEIHLLKDIAVQKCLQDYVCFHGVKTTEQLNTLFDGYDTGIGCLALCRRNADVDTTLKVVEYLCRGIPVISSGYTPLRINGEETFVIKVPNDESVIDISELLKQYEKLDKENSEVISQTARNEFDWENIMLSIFNTFV